MWYNEPVMYYFIVNDHGGSGKAAKTWLTVETALKEKQIPYEAHKTNSVGHATQLAKEITSKEGKLTLVVVGGDGTLNEVLNGISDFDRVSLGVIPTGSGNDFAGGAGIPSDPHKSLELMLNAGEGKMIDIGRVDTELEKGKVFGISSGIGMDAIVCKKALTSKLKNFLNKIGLGKLTYLILTVQTLFSMATEPVKLRFDGGEEEVYDKLIFLASMNYRAEGGGVPMAPDADPCDGELSMCLASGIPRWKAFLDLPVLVMAKHKKLKGFTLRNFKTLDVTCENPMVLHRDGEYGGDVREVHFECMPKKLRLLV